MQTSNTELPQDERLALIVLAVAQALGLLLLHKALTHEVWPATDPRVLYALYAVMVGVPLFLYGGVVRWRERANAYAAGALAVLLGWAGWHVGWLEAPYYQKVMGDSAFVSGLVFSGGLGLFIAGVYFRSWCEAGQLDHARLLDNSWRNALGLGFLGLFLAAFALLLVLWASLFKVIKIDFFVDLFTKAEFIYPVAGLVGGWGIGLIRERVGLIATVRRMCEVLIRALLPLVAFILVIFLATLPVTGLEPLWDTGYAAALLLALAMIMLFGFNAMLADDEAMSLHRWLQPLVLAALVLVPVNAALAAWSLGLRVDQYGWTVDRAWAAFVILFVAAYSLGYALTVLLHRGLRVAAVRHLNVVLGAALALALFLVNTPLVEFHRIAAKSQVERLVDGRTEVAGFDARYLRFELGPYGIGQLEALKTSRFAEGKTALLRAIDDALAMQQRWRVDDGAAVTDLEQLRARIVALPGTTLEDEFLLRLGTREKGVIDCLRRDIDCAVGDVTTGTGTFRIAIHDQAYPYGGVWRRTAAGWTLIGDVRRFDCVGGKEARPDRAAPLVFEDAEFFVLSNGGCLYQVQPDRATLALGAR